MQQKNGRPAVEVEETSQNAPPDCPQYVGPQGDGALLALATVKDDVLQGMVQYLMALAGGDWLRRYMAAARGEQAAATPR